MMLWLVNHIQPVCYSFVMKEMLVMYGMRCVDVTAEAGSVGFS